MKNNKRHIVTIFSFLVLITLGNLNAQDSTYTDSRGNQLPEPLLQPMSLEFQDTPLVEALLKFSEAGSLYLNYTENILPPEWKVTLNLNNKPAIIILKEILRGTYIDVVISKSDQIVLIKLSSAEYNQSINNYTVSGYITDAESGEALIGTNIYINELGTGAATNTYGFYSITVLEGYYTFKVSYIGYHTEEFLVSLYKNTGLNVELRKKSFEIDTVIVTSTLEKDFLKSTEIGTIQLNLQKLANVPHLLGEQDLLKTLHLLPGVTFGREGDAGFYVRGGEFDQNLTLLDEAPVYCTFHSFGLFSVFNSDAIKNVKLIKGAAPPKYGGRLSSVLDIQMNEGNMKEFQGIAGLGTIFSRFTLQGPIIKDKSSFIISGRRTYFDLFKIFSTNMDDLDFYFYDFNAKVNYRISDNNRIYISGYLGSDVLGITDDFQMSWGNTTGTLRWNHLFSDRLFSNTSLIYSSFTHETLIQSEEASDDKVKVISKVNDVTLKEDFEFFLDSKNMYNFGLNYIYHSFLPGHISVEGDNLFEFIIGKRNAHEVSVYASHIHDFNERLKVDYGFRTTLFSVEGRADTYTLSDFEDAPDLDLHENENTEYWRFEPRISMIYQLDDISSIKAGFSTNHQYLHMLSNAISGTPFDVWQPSSARVKPQRSDQISIGYFRSLENQEYELSVEAYYKHLRNVIDLKDGANLILKNYFESELAFGSGRAYGLELFLKKNIGSLTGWVGYTISRSERQIGQINNGRTYPSKYDRTHDLSIVASYRFNQKWTISTNWIYSSGYNVTLPYGQYTIDDKTFNAYTDRNAYRLPAYHRLDLGLSYTNDLGGTWNFSLYNAYDHKNTYIVSVRNKNSTPGKKEAVAYNLFSIVPSISYTLKF
ncbi:carboxypeptidase-like regulatory domain-containing protein [Bacteroidota bacterium]